MGVSYMQQIQDGGKYTGRNMFALVQPGMKVNGTSNGSTVAFTYQK